MGNSDNSGRPRGVLTDRDRKYLKLTEEERREEFSPSARTKARKDICQRVRDAALDFSYLADALDEELLNTVFAPERGLTEIDGEEVHSSQIKESKLFVPAGVEFLIRAALADERRDRTPLVGVESAISPFLSDVERGIESWLNHQGVYAEVSVSVEAEDLKPVDSLVTELAQGEEPDLGLEYFNIRGVLSRAGYSTEEIDELVGDSPLVEKDSGDDEPTE